MEKQTNLAFLIFLVNEGQSLLAFSLARKKMGDRVMLDGETLDLSFLQAKYQRLETYVRQRILPRHEASQSQKEIENTLLNFLQKYSSSGIEQVSELEKYLDQNLREKLGAIEEFCFQKKLYPYTPVKIWVLMNEKPKRTFDYFERFRPGLGASIQLDFDEFVNRELPQSGNSYEAIEWSDMRSMQKALLIAQFEEKKQLSERHFLLGTVLSPSNTINALKGVHDFDKWEFLKFLLEP